MKVAAGRTTKTGRLRSRGTLLVLCSLLSCKRTAWDPPAPDRSGGEIPLLSAGRVPTGAIRLDGHLDEAAWKAAGDSGGFVNPGTGRPEPRSRVKGAGRVAWDDQHLYLAFVIGDGDPVTPFRADEVDPHLWERSSAIEVMIQPGDPGNNSHYYELQVDPAGAVWDTRFDDYNQPITAGPDGRRRFGHQEWSSRVQKGIAIDRAAGRYTIELALPWDALASPNASAPPRAGDVWRMNFYSFRDGQRDALAWSPTLGEGNFHRSARFGRVRFDVR
jgi:cellulose/xylan binding protein with CBM9 domain